MLVCAGVVLGLVVNSADAEGALDNAAQTFLRHFQFCASSQHFGVPPELIAGVMLAENQLNRGWKDTVQDALFQGLVNYRNNDWWSGWARNAVALVQNAESVRLISNKWPLDVLATGFVFSIGPAQITPRTALQMCSGLNPKPKQCLGGVKQIIAALLSDTESPEMAAAVLRFEAESHLRSTGKDVAGDLEEWATIYNFGGEYYRKMLRDSKGEKSNRFGRWVGFHSNEIRLLLDCRRSDNREKQ